MKKTILLVTNDSASRETWSGSTQLHNRELVLAENVRQALDCCDSRPPDLVVINLDWRDENGADSRRLIEQVLDANPGIPVVLVTGGFDFREAVAGPDARAKLEKPLDAAGLARAADRITAELSDLRPGQTWNQTKTSHRLPSDANAFGEATSQRTTVLVEQVRQPRNWGLNE